MYILGLHGWLRREHDPSACLVKDGEIIAMAEEERFIRSKHAFDVLPVNAIKFCLDRAGIDINQVDLITLGYDRQKLANIRGLKFNLSDQEIVEVLLSRKYFKYNKTPNFNMIDHHLSHAASAYYTSGFQDAAVLVIDGQGEDCSTSLGYAKDGKIVFFSKIPIENSLGYFYEAIGKFIGFSLHDAGKVMGLAAYGNPKRYPFRNVKNTKDDYQVYFGHKLKLFERKNSEIDEQSVLIEAWEDYLNKEGLAPRKANYVFNQEVSTMEKDIQLDSLAKDLAASLQRKIEEVVLHLCEVLKVKTKSDNLVISGGVGLNCSANGKIVASKIFKSVFIFPAANDAGVALGSALYGYYTKQRYSKKKQINNVYWGPDFSSQSVEEILKKAKIGYQYCANIEEKTAELLSKGKIVGWFQGRMEVGPRALGNRSILADPREKKNHDRVNAIKGRENWRPLSPSIISGFEKDYFEEGVSSFFMLKSFVVKEEVKKKIPAVVHVDGTARPQSVSNGNNPRYFTLLKKFDKITGIPVLLNTSFNGPGEPIVCNPLDAIKIFYTSQLDCLVINDYLIQKKD